MRHLQRISQTVGVLLSHGYFAVFFSGHIYRGTLKGLCLPFISCYACPMAVFSCPIGSLQHFMTIRTIPLLLLGILGLVGATAGRMACGWLCPFGLLQDMLQKIPTRKIQIPRALYNLKYLSLALLVIIIPFLTGAPWFSKLCPFGTLSAGIPWVLIGARGAPSEHAVIAPEEVGSLFALKLLVLAVFLGLFVVTRRPFCLTTCPLGAFFSLFNRFSVVRLRVRESCRSCGACQKKCPVGLQVSVDANSRECVRCLRCTTCKHVSVEIGSAVLMPVLRARETVTDG